MTSDEITRLTKAIAVLRPDWPSKAVHSYLTDRQSLKAYRDVALALVWVALDRETRSPARIDAPGPWWDAVNSQVVEAPPQPSQFDSVTLRPPEPGDGPAGIAACRDALTDAGRTAARARQESDEAKRTAQERAQKRAAERGAHSAAGE